MKGGLLAKKEQNEKALAAWIAADPARQKEYGDVLPALAALQAEAEKTRERDAVVRRRSSRSSSMLNAAHTAHLLSVEKARKNDLDREPEYQERNWSRIREGQERAQRTIDARIDRALLALGDGPRGGAPRRAADRRPRQAGGPDPGHGEGRLRPGDRRLPRAGSSRGRSWPTRTSAWACSTRRRPRSPPPGTRWSTSRSPSTRSYQQNREAAKKRQGAGLADRPALHAGPARAGGRPRGAGRQRHAAGDLRHR